MAGPIRSDDKDERGNRGKPPGGSESLGLFPLPAVLVPGAAMALRVFEPRYLDLIGDSSRRGRGFGVCLILDGDKSGTPAAPAAFGTEALIEDFGTGEDGVLTLRVRGARRFHAQRMHVRSDGLQFADVTWCDPDPIEPVRPEHGLLATLLVGMVEHAGGEHARAQQACYDDAAWVGWRLAELLPLQSPQRQQLLQLENPHDRLDHLLTLLPEL